MGVSFEKLSGSNESAEPTCPSLGTSAPPCRTEKPGVSRQAGASRYGWAWVGSGSGGAQWLLGTVPWSSLIDWGVA